MSAYDQAERDEMVTVTLPAHDTGPGERMSPWTSTIYNVFRMSVCTHMSLLIMVASYVNMTSLLFFNLFVLHFYPIVRFFYQMWMFEQTCRCIDSRTTWCLYIEQSLLAVLIDFLVFSNGIVMCSDDNQNTWIAFASMVSCSLAVFSRGILDLFRTTRIKYMIVFVMAVFLIWAGIFVPIIVRIVLYPEILTLFRLTVIFCFFLYGVLHAYSLRCDVNLRFAFLLSEFLNIVLKSVVTIGCILSLPRTGGTICSPVVT